MTIMEDYVRQFVLDVGHPVFGTTDPAVLRDDIVRFLDLSYDTREYREIACKMLVNSEEGAPSEKERLLLEREADGCVFEAVALARTEYAEKREYPRVVYLLCLYRLSFGNTTNGAGFESAIRGLYHAILAAKPPMSVLSWLSGLCEELFGMLDWEDALLVVFLWAATAVKMGEDAQLNEYVTVAARRKGHGLEDAVNMWWSRSTWGLSRIGKRTIALFNGITGDSPELVPVAGKVASQVEDVFRVLALSSEESQHR